MERKKAILWIQVEASVLVNQHDQIEEVDEIREIREIGEDVKFID